MTMYFSAATNGFYDDAITAVLPDDCVEITAETHAALMEAQAAGQGIAAAEDGTPQAVERTVTLAEAQAAAIARIDAEAESVRLEYITGGAGQAMVYLQKRTEAVDALANYTTDNPPATGTYPLLDAEIGITADTVLGVAASISTQAATWAATAAAIESVRLTAKAAISEATDTVTIATILSGLSWPSTTDTTASDTTA